MTKATLFFLMAVPLFAGITLGADSTNGTPKGWFAAGSNPNEYRMQSDRKVTRSGKGSAIIKCLTKKPSGFGTLMQSISAENYLGKRLRLSGWVKSSAASGCGLWLRVDGFKGQILSFDNMRERGGIPADRDWSRYDIVLDVPESSASLNFGILLVGGTAWADDLQIEVVDKSVPLTAKPEPRVTVPLNMDFEE